MLGKTRALGKWKSANSWQAICNQSNLRFTNGLATVSEEVRVSDDWRSPKTCRSGRQMILAAASDIFFGPRKDLILQPSYEFISRTQPSGPTRIRGRICDTLEKLE